MRTSYENFTFSIDSDLKKNVEEICSKLGMTLATALTIFCHKVQEEQKIPFEITNEEDSFYRPENIAYLKEQIQKLKNGELALVKNALLDED